VLSDLFDYLMDLVSRFWPGVLVGLVAGYLSWRFHPDWRVASAAVVVGSFTGTAARYALSEKARQVSIAWIAFDGVMSVVVVGLVGLALVMWQAALLLAVLGGVAAYVLG
jgi:hypothetical protein